MNTKTAVMAIWTQDNAATAPVFPFNQSCSIVVPITWELALARKPVSAARWAS